MYPRILQTIALAALISACGSRQAPIDGVPPVSRGAMMAAMPTGRMVLFGGTFDEPYDRSRGFFNSNALSGETWSWSVQEGWARVATTGPSPRAYGTLAYDPTLGELVLFGGLAGDSEACPAADGSTGFCHDVWAFDGDDWRALESHPDARTHHAMAWSPAQRAMLIAGGLDQSGTYAPVAARKLGEASELREPGHFALTSPSMVWDSSRDVMLLLHGNFPHQCSSGDRNRSVFGWIGEQWEMLKLHAGPGTSSAKAFFDERRGQVVSVSGIRDVAVGDCRGEALAEGTRVLGPGGFEALDVPSPPGRIAPGLAYDRLGGRALLFGGYTLAGPELQDTWLWDGEGWTEQ